MSIDTQFARLSQVDSLSVSRANGLSKLASCPRPVPACTPADGRLVAGKAPHGAARRRDADADEDSAERGALEDAFVLLNLQAGAVWLALDAQKRRARDGEPRAKEDFVAVFLDHGLRGAARHADAAGNEGNAWGKKEKIGECKCGCECECR